MQLQVTRRPHLHFKVTFFHLYARLPAALLQVSQRVLPPSLKARLPPFPAQLIQSSNIPQVPQLPVVQAQHQVCSLQVDTLRCHWHPRFLARALLNIRACLHLRRRLRHPSFLQPSLFNPHPRQKAV
jgi:hypothetical protein